jgi:hypothetical protein
VRALFDHPTFLLVLAAFENELTYNRLKVNITRIFDGTINNHIPVPIWVIWNCLRFVVVYTVRRIDHVFEIELF